MKQLFIPLMLALGMSSINVQATVVEFQTSEGNFKVNLHDETTPETVNNFLNYVTQGKYDNTIIHRTVDDFVIQGGGAKFEGTLPPTWIDTDEPITNEPVYSNVTGTIAMAKRAGKINSATSQWFINTQNNASILDAVDVYGGGAYAVFGEVIDDGMDVVNAIAEIERCNTGYAGFKELPMPNYQEFCGNNDATPGQENFVTIYQVIIFDDTVSTDGDLASIKNTRYDPNDSQKDKQSSGGSFSWFSLLLMLLVVPLTRK
ncbi:peptidylprolyl isomerase [Thalassotalea sp. G2M2-11]|uniref:peptidylprolyl isomerase n=1 Tax=Thalassotalea sp. G2M2-11 TaxID=2787627 RepID=UPI0019D1A061|nr:peptidylprolyl isomerase [Thalassotalea sp. G2M2-11]